MLIKTEEDALLTYWYCLGSSWVNCSASPGELKRQEAPEHSVCRRWRQSYRVLMAEWCSTMHIPGSHKLMATSIGHGAYLPLAGKVSVYLVALSHHRNIKPGGTLKMSPWPWLKKDRPKLVHPERCFWSLPKQSYHFHLDLKDRENWLLPWSSQQLHITLSVVEAALKLFRSCVLLKKCILSAPFLAFISLLPSRCSILRSVSVLQFAVLPIYQPQTAAVLPVWTKIHPNLLCVIVGAELPLLSRLQMHSSVIESSAYSQL